MALLPSDTIYKDLIRKGLGLTEGLKISVPPPEAKKTNLLSKLSSFVNRKTEELDFLPMKVIQVMNNVFLVVRTFSIFVYNYSYDEVEKKIDVKLVSTTSLFYAVEEVYSCLERYAQDRDYPLLLKSKDGVGYFNFDFKELKLVENNFIKLANITGIGWISDKECLIINERNACHYVITNQTLKQKSVHANNLKIGHNETVKKMWIIGHIDEQQDSNIPIFYAVTEKKINEEEKHPAITLRIKEFTRTLDGDIIEAAKPDFEVETRKLEYRNNFNIISVGDYYCLQLSKEVLILKKKFDKYMLLDNMVEIMNGFHIRLCKKGLIASIGEKLIELNCIRFSDPKCVSKILDVIEFPPDLLEYNHNFYEIWPILIGKEFTLIFVFVKDHDIILSGLQKQEPMVKMLELAKVKGKENLEVVQDMASNLGIERKDFYLKLWANSFKTNSEIYQYLIPCKNVLSIRKELKSTLKTRKIQVSEMLKILEKITEINVMNLKTDLNQKNLREYAKNEFLRRKIKLNEMDKELDHKCFETIYNSSLLTILCSIVSAEINPVTHKVDPLNNLANQEVSKDLKSLENVLQEFKVILLEDYETFLRKFLSNFPNQILQVIERFSFLLPNYPFEIDVQKPSKTNEPILNDPKTNGTSQQIWFQTVSVREWQGELTKERILKEFFHDYPTSKITETVDEFYTSLYGQENKGWKHGIITLGIDDYTKKIKALNGTQLYLNVCEFVNELSVENNDEEPISKKLLEILKRKNNLSEPDMHHCKLYSSMHYFMLKNKIFSKTKLDITTLVNLKPENLVAIFFLENKQRKEHIFSEFKDLYEDKKEFHSVLSKFVESENCSRIELEILMNEMIEKGNEFQEQNQDLIELLISGICMKVEIRENLLILDAEDDDEEEGSIIDDVQLSKILALKINRVKQLKRAKNIFRIFGLEKKTYQELLDLEENYEIFKLILSKYFALFEIESEADENGESALERSINLDVFIEGVVVNIESRGGMLKLLIYLQEAIYYSAEIEEIFLIFGEELIWQREFDEIRALINDENILETLKLNKEHILNELILRALKYIYTEPEILYKEETKEQILSILNIDEYQSKLKEREIARLDLADILCSWELDVHPLEIYTMCSVWKNEDRVGIMTDLILSYIEHINFDTLKRIFELLEIIDKETSEINLENNKEFAGYCNIYAKQLIEKQRYLEVLNVIVFLMKVPDEPINYTMLAESYIQTIIKNYQNINDGRKFIEFFVQKYHANEVYSIRQLLESDFDETVIGLWDRSPTINISSIFFYDSTKNLHCEVQLDDVWEISTKEGSTTADTYYNYFFLIMGLSNPKKGFSETVGISYNLEKITQILIGDLKDLVESKEDLWAINFVLFEAIFLFEGMLGEAADLLEIHIDNDIKSKLDLIMKELRMRRAENEKIDKILNILTKLKAEVYNKVKANERKERFKKKLKEIVDLEHERNRFEETPVEVTQTENSQPEVFLNWRRVVEDKRTISNMSNDPLSEKNLIDEVFKFDASRNMDYSPAKENKNKQKRQNSYDYLFLPFKGAEKNEDLLIKLIKQERFDEIGNYPREEVAAAIQKIYDESPDYLEVINVLEKGNLGDPEKKELFGLAKLYPLSNNIRKKLFNLQFLMTPIAYGEEDENKFSLLYEELQPVIKEIVKGISLHDLKELANILTFILESFEYSARVFMESLLYIGENYQFDSSSAFMAQECIVGIVEYPEIVLNNYQKILESMSLDKEMRSYVREVLVKLMTEKNYKEVAKEIKHYLAH